MRYFEAGVNQVSYGPKVQKMSSTSISLITIVFNGQKHIEKTILSVIEQAYSPLEYVIIDGGSTDGTLDIIRKYEQHISFWSSGPDKGIYDALNKGLKQVKGDLIGFVNSDDWLEPNALKEVAQGYQKDKIIYGNVRFWKNGKELNVSNSDHTRLIEGMTMAHPAVFVPRSLYDRYGEFKTGFRIAADYEMMVRFFVNKVDFVQVGKVLSNMNIGGVSHTHWLEAIKEDLRIRNSYFGNKILNYLYFLKQFLYLLFERTLRKFS